MKSTLVVVLAMLLAGCGREGNITNRFYCEATTSIGKVTFSNTTYQSGEHLLDVWVAGKDHNAIQTADTNGVIEVTSNGKTYIFTGPKIPPTISGDGFTFKFETSQCNTF